MRVVILFNPISGAGRAASAARELARSLRGAGHEVEIAQTAAGTPRDVLLQKMKGAGAMVVCGGDGSVRAAAPTAIESDTPLYQVPLGTENLFAREFVMSRKADALLAALTRAEVRRVDVAEANGRLFVLMASIGFDAEVVHDLSARRGRRISRLSYLPPILRQLVRWQSPRLTITVDGAALDGATRGFVVVANSRQYGARFNPAPAADMTDGLLDLVFFPCSTRRELVGWARRCRRGRQGEDSRLVSRRGREIEIVTAAPVRYQLDGDPPDAARRGDHLESAAGGLITKLNVRIRPRALPVLLPADGS